MNRTARATLFVAVLAALTAPGLARAEGARVEKALALQPGGSFVLEADQGSVQVTGTDRSGARVVVTSRAADFQERYDLNFEEGDGKTVRVTLERKDRGFLGFLRRVRGDSIHFEVEVPSETTVSVDTAGGAITISGINGEVKLDTSGGGIEVSGVTGNVLADTSGGAISIRDVHGNADLDTSGGSITASGVQGSVRADTSGGPIRIADVTGDVAADTSGGGITVENAGGKVVADTSGGSIEVSFAGGNGAGGNLDTSGGSIRVRLDPKVNLTLDAESSGGSVRTDLPVKVRGKVEKGTLRGDLGSGGNLLRVRTSGGGIRIDPL